MKKNINSRQYWDSRFELEKWGTYGEEQSGFFAKIAINSLPLWLSDAFDSSNYTIFDYGCAEGNGTSIIAERYPNCRVVGLDFSSKAIEHASSMHSNCEFECVDIVKDELKPADVVFSSNTLEHIDSPRKILEKMVLSAKKFAILLLPFEDNSGIEEHVNIFDISSFPNTIKESAKLCFFKIIDCRLLENTYWEGKQILLVYNCDEASTHDFNAKDIYEYHISSLIEQKYQLEYQLSRAYENMFERENKLKDTLKKYEEILGKSIQATRESVEKSRLLTERITIIGNAKPYKLAHVLVEGKHLLFGTNQERKAIQKWLCKDRSIQTGYNYIKELYDIVESVICEMQNSETIEERAIEEVKKQIQEISLYQERKSEEISIRKLLARNQGKNIFIMPSLIDWNVPLFQRPQQVAIAMGRAGIPVIYFTWNIVDQISKPVVVSDNCLLIKAETVDIVLEKMVSLIELSKEYGSDPIIDLYSTGNMYDLSFIDKLKKYDYKMLYEYIDEISEDISGQEIPEALLELHTSLIQDKSTFVVATADKLYRDVLSIRGSEVNTLNSGNGVDISHFQVSKDPAMLPKDLEWIKRTKRPIIGYFGAIAKWFDFDLILEASKLRPDYDFLLIGPEYCEELNVIDVLHKRENIHYIGMIPYGVLPHVACYFTVATIPFLINDITESTSPLKLFEYMAMGKPIVTTPMKECLKIPEVLIARTPKEYVSCIDHAINITRGSRRIEHEKRMKDIAESHSWERKAKEIIDLINTNQQ